MHIYPSTKKIGLKVGYSRKPDIKNPLYLQGIFMVEVRGIEPLPPFILIKFQYISPLYMHLFFV